MESEFFSDGQGMQHVPFLKGSDVLARYHIHLLVQPGKEFQELLEA
jgi:hypothetical protein